MPVRKSRKRRSRSPCRYGRKKSVRRGCKKRSGPKRKSRRRSRKRRSRRKSRKRSRRKYGYKMNPVLRDWPLPIDRKVVYEEILNKITQTREWIDRLKRNGIEFNKEFPQVLSLIHI